MEDFEGKPVCVCSWGFLGASCELAGYVGGRDLAPLTEDTIAQVRLVEATFQQQLYPPCCGVDCGTHGTCVGNGTCDCDHGWSGPACAVADPCLTRNCSGHGLCQLGTGGHCSCNHGFYGRDCEIQGACMWGLITCSLLCPAHQRLTRSWLSVAHADPCLGVTCSGHGQCWQGTCACKEGWTGSTCDQLRECQRGRFSAAAVLAAPEAHTALCELSLLLAAAAGPGCLVSPVCNSRGTICPKMLRRRRLAEAMKLDAVIVPGGPSLTCTCQRNYKGDACEIDSEFCKLQHLQAAGCKSCLRASHTHCRPPGLLLLQCAPTRPACMAAAAAATAHVAATASAAGSAPVVTCPTRVLGSAATTLDTATWPPTTRQCAAAWTAGWGATYPMEAALLSAPATRLACTVCCATRWIRLRTPAFASWTGKGRAVIKLVSKLVGWACFAVHARCGDGSC